MDAPSGDNCLPTLVTAKLTDWLLIWNPIFGICVQKRRITAEFWCKVTAVIEKENSDVCDCEKIVFRSKNESENE